MTDNIIDFKEWFDLNKAAPQYVSQMMGHSESTSEIKARLISNLSGVLSYLLPGGVFKNNKFYVGDIRGNMGESLVIDISGDKAGM